MFECTKVLRKFATLLVSLTLCLTMATQALAVPASPKLVKVKQADGSTISVRVQGDEHFNWRTTEDGYAISEREGYYFYANYNADGTLALSNQRVMIDGIKKMPTNAIQKPQLGTLRAQSGAARRAKAAATTSSSSGFPNKGDIKAVVILVEYSDVKFSVADPNTAFTNQLNQENYSVEGATGSARDYFLTNSGGEFRGQFDVYGPYELGQPQRFYGANTAAGTDIRPSEMIEEAVKLADRDGVDFSQYDQNNDGHIDNVFVYYAGRSEAEGGSTDCIWPHKWNVSNKPVFDGKILDVYACSSELRGSDAEPATITGIGTFCHEFSHVFGLADHYDTTGNSDGTSYGLGNYDIMTTGSYNNDGNTPPLHNALERYMIGWAEPIELDFEGDVTLAPINDGKVYKMSTDVEGEYFLFENRNRSHSIWDSFIPGEGLLITHVDRSEPYMPRWESNYPNGDTFHECFRIVPANNYVPTNSGWESVTYPYLASPWSQNNEWSPNSKPKAASWSGSLMPYQLTNIAKDGENVTFKVSASVINPISGVVKDAYGSFVTGAEITLATTDGSFSTSGTTDSVGVMSFEATTIPNGKYTLTVKAAGYVDYVKEFDLYQGIIVNVTMFSEAQSNMVEVKLHNGEYSHSVGYAQTRPMAIIPASELKDHIGRAITEVRLFATAKFDGQVIIQPGLYGAGWSPGPISVTNADLGWYTVDFTGTNSSSVTKNIIIEPNTDYYVKVMLISAGNAPLGMDTSLDQSMYKYTSLMDISGTDPQTIYDSYGLEGNLMISLALSEENIYVAPTSFNTNPKYDEGIDISVNEILPLEWAAVPANGHPSCNWSSSDESVVTVSGTGELFGIGDGTATVKGVSIVDPEVKMEFTVNVKTREARAKGRVVEWGTDNGVGGILLKAYPITPAAPRAPKAEAQALLKSSNKAAVSPIAGANFTTSGIDIETANEPEFTVATSDDNGDYFLSNLTAGNRYKLVLDQDQQTDRWTSRSETTYYPMVAYDDSKPEQTINKLGDFGLLQNTLFGTERFAYWEGTPNPLYFGDETLVMMYAIRIPASELKDKIGYTISHADAYVEAMSDPYMESVVFTLDEATGELVFQGGTSFGEAETVPVNGYHLFEYPESEPIIIRPETDYYVALKMMGQVGTQADINNAHDGYSNLIWTEQGFVSLNDIDFAYYADWQMSMYTRPRDIDPVTEINVTASADNTSATPYVGVDFALNATVAPATAVYLDVVWSSSDDSIATVNQKGELKLLKAGDVVISATSKEYSSIKGEYPLSVQLRQGTQAEVINSDGNLVAGATVTYYATEASASSASSSALSRTSYTRTSAAGISATSDENGAYYIDLEPGVYEVEAKRDGLIDYQGVVTIKYGMNYTQVMMLQYVETLSEFVSYAAPQIDGSLGDESYNFIPYTYWTADELEGYVGKKITRLKALVVGGANIRFTVFTPDLSKFIYRSSVIEVPEYSVEMVVHDIPAEYYIDIEEGKEYCIGYEVADYAQDASPAVISLASPTIPGKSDCVLFRNSPTDLTTMFSESVGSWVIGFYVQDSEQIKGLDLTVGQHDAVATWNPTIYTSFRLTYSTEGGTEQSVTLTDCKYEFSGLEASTKYNIKVEGSTDGDYFTEIVSSSFTTLGQKSTIPMVMLKAYDGYKAGEALTLKTLNTTSTDQVEWFLDGEKLSRNILILESGEHKVQCRVTRGAQSFVTTRRITVK